jgi:hypothetical protein
MIFLHLFSGWLLLFFRTAHVGFILPAYSVYLGPLGRCGAGDQAAREQYFSRK